PDQYFWPNNSVKNATILGNNYSCNTTNFRLNLSDSSNSNEEKGMITSSGANGFNFSESEDVAFLGQWQMISLVVNGNIAKLYKNGLEISSSATADYDISGCLTIGLHHQGNGKWYYFNGKIDDIGLWSEVLSPAEVYQLFTGVIDTVSPTVVLSHNASPTTTTVSNGDTVTVTATFSEAMTATPTINISAGQATDVAMSATASSAVWAYTWTVSSSVATEVSVTVSGTDLAGNAYSGTDSLTLRLEEIFIPPTVILTDSDVDNIVAFSDMITFDATFSDSISSTPTISIIASDTYNSTLLTIVENASLQYDSGNNWQYVWTVNTSQ
ncbi:hypothetical protein N9548_04075, partial [Flavobacteriaceae bacterium]|nr:hypothetical protein [Flavobacteriaceae bacterium]